MKKNYGFRTVYISIEKELQKSDFREIKKYISEKVSNKNKQWYKYIVLESHMMTDKDSKNCKALYKEFCSKHNADCIKKKATIVHKIGTGAIKKTNYILSKIPILKITKIDIPEYKYIGYCKIDITKSSTKA